VGEKESHARNICLHSNHHYFALTSVTAEESSGNKDRTPKGPFPHGQGAHEIIPETRQGLARCTEDNTGGYMEG